MTAPARASEHSNCKIQCVSLSLFTFISSAFVFFFHFNFKTVIDHYCGQDPRIRHNISPSFQGWQEVGTLKESTVNACVEWDPQFTLKLLLHLIKGWDDSLSWGNRASPLETYIPYSSCKMVGFINSIWC